MRFFNTAGPIKPDLYSSREEKIFRRSERARDYVIEVWGM